MKNILQKIHAFLVKLPIVWFVLIILVLYYIVGLIYYPLNSIIQETPYYSKSFSFFSLPLWLQFILVIPGSYIITIIFWWLIFKIFRHFKYFINKSFIIILVSSLLGSVLYFGHLTSFIVTFLAGLILGYSYIIAEEKKLSPVLIVTIIISLEMVIEIVTEYAFY